MVFDSKKLDELLQFVLAVAGKAGDFSRELGRIHLIKYVYLADLVHAQHHDGVTYTGLTWKFHDFGPWSIECYNRTEPAMKAIGAHPVEFQSEKYGDLIKWYTDDDALFDRLNDRIELTVSGAVQQYVRRFGNDTYGLLDFVYKTVPMLNAAPGDTLDFGHVRVPVQETKEEKVDSETQLTARQQKIRHKKILEFKKILNQRLEEKVKARKLAACHNPPRYDDVFFEGLEKLDETAGVPPTEGESLVIFTDDVWKSKARYDPELS